MRCSNPADDLANVPQMKVVGANNRRIHEGCVGLHLLLGGIRGDCRLAGNIPNLITCIREREVLALHRGRCKQGPSAFV